MPQTGPVDVCTVGTAGSQATGVAVPEAVGALDEAGVEVGLLEHAVATTPAKTTSDAQRIQDFTSAPIITGLDIAGNLAPA